MYDPYSQASSLLPSATSGIIPANVLGAWGMTINTSQINFASSTGGVMFGYSGTPGAGNLYFSLAPNGGQDQFGNVYSGGITANSGTLNGVSIVGAVMDATTTLQGSNIQMPQILNPTVTAGTAYSMTHTFMNSSGQVLGYTSGTTAVTFATNGQYQWTCPTGITQARIQCWGAGGGGDGGNTTRGGAGGGGGEYAEEPGYSVTPGVVYTVIVGQGGGGGDTGNGGGDGTNTQFFATGNPGGLNVIANAGLGGGFNPGVGGQGGFGSLNTIHFNGGNGGNISGSTGGNGGGSSAGPASQGNGGNQSSSSVGGTGGAAVSGGGAGGNGGNNDVNGNAGSGPGGGAGGAGAGNVVTHVKQYQPANGTYSYYGSDSTSGTPLSLRDHDGPLYQGNYFSLGLSTPGNQFSYFTLPYATIQSQLAGVTVTSVVIHIKCLAGFSSPMNCYLQYSNAGSFGNTAPSDTKVHVKTFSVAQGSVAQVNLGLGGGIGVALQNGNAKSICIGPGPSEGAPYSGYFDSGANNGYIPSIFVNYYTGTPTVQGGTGADGKVVISYASATPAIILAVASVSSTDAYGYTFQPGFTGPQLTLNGQATVPSATTGTAVMSASTAGTPVISLPSTLFGQLPLSQTDITNITVTQTVETNITTAWTIPSGDAQAGTLYRLRCYGTGIQGNPQENILPQLNLGGSSVQITVAGTVIPFGNFSWEAECEARVSSVGISGTTDSKISFAWQANAVATTANTTNAVQVGHGRPFNSTIANTYAVQMAWGGIGSTAPTLTCFGSSLERLGP